MEDIFLYTPKWMWIFVYAPQSTHWFCIRAAVFIPLYKWPKSGILLDIIQIRIYHPSCLAERYPLLLSILCIVVSTGNVSYNFSWWKYHFRLAGISLLVLYFCIVSENFPPPLKAVWFSSTIIISEGLYQKLLDSWRNHLVKEINWVRELQLISLLSQTHNRSEASVLHF